MHIFEIEGKGTYCGNCGESMYAHGAECETPECLNGPEGCTGKVEYRMPLSGTGRSFPRCDGHWDVAVEREMQIRERYPEHPPADWSPLDAGEAWGEDDY